MEIRFSKAHAKSVQNPNDPRYANALDNYVSSVVEEQRATAGPIRQHGHAVRFALYTNDGTYGGSNPKPATAETHDRVIRALLTLDPDATIRTARAVYEGLEDFEKQRRK